ncbi:MAG TPA: efflux transporter outer membrane subunit [Thermoanaerobaculia bacterium]|nr:efflux transporter outer membrane subunit [Thermoanaerobaculia bacterium]
MSRQNLSILALAVAGSLLAGCAAGPNYRRPAVAVPEQLRGQPGEGAAGGGQSASLADQAWWQLFKDDALQGLIEEAQRNAYDLRLAVWRVEEARAAAGIASAQYWPQVQVQGQWTRSRQSPAGVGAGGASGASGAGSPPLNLYDVNAGLSWEIDLWGRIRRTNEAALAQTLASEEARRGVLLSLVSDVATAYFQLRELDEQLAIAKRTAAAFQGSYDLFKRRLDAGAASALDTASAEVSLASAAAAVPDLERQIEAQENRLSLLLGRVPGTVPRGAALADQAMPPAVPAGLPSDLLRRRPDLRQAEQQLVAANANVGVAVANFFPTVSLTGAFGGVAPQLAGIFGAGRAWSLGGGLLSPVVQGRRLAAQHRVAVAQWEEAKVEYERSVNNAFSEVATALVAYQKLAGVESEQARAVAVNRDAVRLSNQRYLGGRSDYLEVLQAQQAQFLAENALAQTHFNRLASLVQLYKALGGGWQLADQEWAGPRAAGAAAGK